MAAKRSGESNKPLFIALAVTIPLIIILGLTTYFGYDGKAAAEAKEKEAKADKDKWEKTSDYYRFQAALYRSYMGEALAEDAATLTALRPNFGDTGNGALVTNAVNDNIKDKEAQYIIEKLDKSPQLGWNAGEKKPTSTYAKRIEEVTAQLTAAKADLDNTKLGLTAKQKELEDTKTLMAKEKAKYKEELVSNGKAYADELTKLGNENASLLAKNQADSEDSQKRIQAASADGIAQKKENDKLKKTIDQKDTANKNLEKSVSKVDPLGPDQPKGPPRGRIVDLDPTGTMPYLNLGSDDFVKTNLGFRIFSPDGKEKGRLIVTDVKGAHRSQARIIHWADRDRDPILKGDELFNRVWSPGKPAYVAVAGVVDLNGERKDDIEEFKRLLDPQGIVVDAYIDLKDMAVKGSIGPRVEYFIIGSEPTDIGIRIPDDKAKAYRAKMQEMKDEAAKYSIPVTRLPLYLNEIGYTGNKSERTLK
jgi:hypothetical protein